MSLEVVGLIGLGAYTYSVSKDLDSRLSKLEQIVNGLNTLADVTVERVGDYAVAKGVVFKKSTVHGDVLQYAIDYVSNNGGGIIRIKGVLEVQNPIVPKRNVMLIGVGDYREGSDTFVGDVIKAKESMDAIFDTAEYVENFRILGLGIDGGNLAKVGFRMTQGYRVILNMVEIARVIDKGVEQTGGGEIHVLHSRVNASKEQAFTPSYGIYTTADAQIIDNVVRGFKTGIRVGGGSRAIANHVYGFWRNLDVGIELGSGEAVANYVDGYTRVGIKVVESGAVLVANKINTKENLGTVDAPFVQFDVVGTVYGGVVIANICAPRSGTTVKYAVEFTDNVTDTTELYVLANRFVATSISNRPELMRIAHVPVIDDCTNLPTGRKGELVICYDTTTSTWKAKIHDGTTWQNLD